MAIKVINRSTGNTCYTLPELNIRRVFTVGEVKEIDEKELEALSQQDGGLFLLKNNLIVKDKEWVEKHFDAPIEYWWEPERIKRFMIEDDLELFSETLDYAPEGVIDFIILYSWKLPLKDLNKIEVLKEKTGFDTIGAIAIMQEKEPIQEERKTQRRRREED